MRYIFGISLLLLTLQNVIGQTNSTIPTIVLPKQNNEALRDRELALRSNHRNPEFAVRLETQISPATHGQWQEHNNGQTSWKLQIESPTAHSLNFGFTQFNLPSDATLFIYPPDKSHIYGPFTAADNEVHESLWTPIMAGDALVIELNLPKASKHLVDLQLQYVNHDFMGFSRVISGDCHLDAVCSNEDGWPDLDQYRDVIQSVGLVSIDGRRLCTGFLVNNSRKDCTPYFVTANHCEISRMEARSMVVYWNYQNSYCRLPNQFQNSRPGDGTLNIFNTGAFFLASSETSDFTLVRLDDPVVEEADAYFAGWNVEAHLPQDGIFSIHHPLTEEKRVAISKEVPYPGKWNTGTQFFADGDHLIVPKWTHGSTDEGSSGAPLFNSDKQVIGLLHGGRASCGNEEFDAFGWLRSAWSDGTSSSSRLGDWLDPNREGLEALDGQWATQCEIALVTDLPTQNVCLPAAGNFPLIASDAFNQPIQLDIIYAPEELALQLEQSTLAPGASTSIDYRSNDTIPPGIYNIVIRGSNERDTVYTDLELIIEQDPQSFDLTGPLKNNNEVNESVLLQWFSSPNSKLYEVTIAQDADFTQINDQFTLVDTFLNYDQFDFGQSYFWQVKAINNCGQTWSSIGQFETGPDIRLVLVDTPVAPCLETDLNFRIQLGIGYEGLSQLSAQLIPNPINATISFGQNGHEALPGALVDIQVLNTQELAIGSYQLIVEAEDQQRQGSLTIPFEISGPPPSAVLSLPFDNWIQLTGEVHFTWEAPPTSQPFHLELSDDSDFNQLLVNQEVIGKHTHLQLEAGNYYWRIRNENDCGSSWSSIQNLRVYTHDQIQLNGTRIFIAPTPSSGPLNLHFSEFLENGHLQVLNTQGQLLLEQDIPASYLVSLDLSNYPSGIYFIRMQARRSSVTQKVIIQH